jgi:hypothetical protein
MDVIFGGRTTNELPEQEYHPFPHLLSEFIFNKARVKSDELPIYVFIRNISDKLFEEAQKLSDKEKATIYISLDNEIHFLREVCYCIKHFGY